jgi:hypothetical protein
MTARKLVCGVGFLIGLAGLVLQFGISIPSFMTAGHSLPGAIIKYFSYFTILTNIALVLVYLSELTSAPWLDWFRPAVTRGMMAAAMTLVMAFYHFILAATWQPEGLFLVCDITLHYLTPIVYLLWWLLLAAHRALAYRNIPAMIGPPAAYVAYIMIRGALIAEYPYAVLDANRLGYGQVCINVAVLLAVFAGLCAIAVAADHALPRREAAVA